MDLDEPELKKRPGVTLRMLGYHVAENKVGGQTNPSFDDNSTIVRIQYMFTSIYPLHYSSFTTVSECPSDLPGWMWSRMRCFCAGVNTALAVSSSPSCLPVS